MAQTPKKGKYEECLGEGRWLVFQNGEALFFFFFLINFNCIKHQKKQRVGNPPYKQTL